jgi:tRNA (cytidine/uridine-2'-O-)-methyltransferase
MKNKSRFKIVLFKPEIPGNTGTIGRTCLALGIDLILIKPYGFDIDEKAVRRAGLDYWKHISLTEYDSWDDFIENEKPDDEKLFFMSTKGKETYFEANFVQDSYIVFGQETKGLPSSIHERYAERLFTLPMFSEHIRSLNLSNTATAVAYEALRQIGF